MSKRKHKPPRLRWLPPHAALMNGLIKVTKVTEEMARRWAAHHEATHVVVALLLGLEIDYVEVGAAGSGFQAFRSPQWFSDHCGPAPKHLLTLAALDAQQRDYIYRRLVSVMAGWCAEQILPGYFGYRLPELSGSGDQKNASSLALLLAEGEPSRAQELMNLATAAARQMLEENAEAVLALGERLYEKGRMTAAEIDDLLAVTA